MSSKRISFIESDAEQVQVRHHMAPSSALSSARSSTLSAIESDAEPVSNAQHHHIAELSDFGTLADYDPKYIAPEDKSFLSSEKYSGKSKGRIYVFNHYEYDQEKFEENMKVREGTTTDVRVIRECFKKFGFTFTSYDNKTKDEIIRILKNVEKEDEECFGVFILSHGKMNRIAALDGYYDEEDILEVMKKNPNLEGKLKFFVFQVCRTNAKSNDGEKPLLPLSEDMLVVHSTYPDNASYRDIEQGTYLIRILCKRLNLMKEENNILDELLFVTRDVGRETGGEQMVVVSYNMKKVFTLKPLDDDDDIETC